MDRAPPARLSPSPFAVAAWVFDTLAAILFALALAQLLSFPIGRAFGGGGGPGWGWALLLIAAALMRGGSQGAAALLGQREIGRASCRERV